MEKMKAAIWRWVRGGDPGRRAHHWRRRASWGAALVLCLLSVNPGAARPGRASGLRAAAAEPQDLRRLRAEARKLEAEVEKLQAARSRLFRSRPAILVDTVKNRICVVQGERVLACGKCSTGSGAELTDTATGRRWVFDTPRGYFSAKGKISNPVWRRPDWAFVEEGVPVPRNAAERHVAEVLGDYAIGFGDGFFIHGTLYTRLLGANVTHGCIRADDDILEKIFEFAQPGTPIWIY